MPDHPKCKHSTFYRHPTIRGAALSSGHVRYCDKLNPEHPDYDPRFVDAYPEMSYQLMGLEVPEKHRRKLQIASGNHPEIPPKPERKKKPDKPPKQMILADDDKHQIAYEGAINCPHRVESNSCCAPDKCGTEGEKPGQKIDIGVCYECTIERLNIV